MFRRSRWLLLVAIAAIAGFTTYTFYKSRAARRRAAPKASAPLAENISAASQGWVYDQTKGDRTALRAKARTFQQIKEPPSMLLEDVEIQLFKEDGKTFDLVKSAHATLDNNAGTVYSDGEVEITMAVPLEGTPNAHLLGIKSSGVTCDIKSSRVSTDRKATFAFDRGDGESVGAEYDPSTRELHLKSEVKLNWKGANPKTKPMQVESGELIYKEGESEVFLFPWAKLKREQFLLETADAVVVLKQGVIDRIDGQQARGSDTFPNRRLEYAAKSLHVFLTPKGEVRQIQGNEDAVLTSITSTARTTMTADNVDLEFDTATGESALSKATGTGKSRVEAKPVARPGVPTPDTRILTSEVIEMKLRPGGKELETVVTHTPGQIDFLPNRKDQKKRHMDGERIAIAYGKENQIQSFRSVNVKTRTESEDKNKKPVISTTSSHDLMAYFDEKSGQMTKFEQWNDFVYEEGTRHARAEHATQEQTTETILLKGKARTWDETGSTAANEINLDQKAGTMVALGNVASTHLPDKKPSSGMLSNGDEPLQARAAKMTSSEKNQKIRYEGSAVVWQGASRIAADQVLIDRAARRLEAAGNVVSTFPDQDSKANTTSIVHSAQMVYTDSERMAFYSGGVHLERVGLDVVSREMRAWFREDPKGNKLDRLFADGKVVINQRAADRTRHSEGEHSEYYLEDEKMVLNGGSPVLNDSLRGVTRGNVLTWYARQDRLIVDNTESGSSVSRILRK
jgi:lipopolysaccharide export system protein LptA